MSSFLLRDVRSGHCVSYEAGSNGIGSRSIPAAFLVGEFIYKQPGRDHSYYRIRHALLDAVPVENRRFYVDLGSNILYAYSERFGDFGDGLTWFRLGEDIEFINKILI